VTFSLAEGYGGDIELISAVKQRDTINVTREGLGEAYDEKIKGFFHELVWRMRLL